MIHSRKNLLRRARAQRADEDWDGMRRTMGDVGALLKADIKKMVKVTNEEMAFFSISYKHSAEQRRRDIFDMERPDQQSKAKHIAKRRPQLVEELKGICFEMIALIDEELLARNTYDNQREVFYLKEKGDFFRYLAETVVSNADVVTKNDFVKSAEKSYQSAMELARTKLKATDHVRLATAINFGVLLHDVKKRADEACQVAQRELAESHQLCLKALDPTTPKDKFQLSIRARYLLEENSALWAGEATL